MPSTYGTKRAVNELLAILDGQWSNGMLPQIRFMPRQTGYRPDADDWGITTAISGPTAVRTSGITQPPIMGLCAWEVFRKLDEEARETHYGDFRRIAGGFDRYHDWLLAERDPWGEHLVVCLHPWETGTDNSPAFDQLIESSRVYIEEQGLPVSTFGRADTVHVNAEHRPTDRDYFAYFGLMSLFKSLAYDQWAIIERTPFLLQDVLFNSLLVASLHALADLQGALSQLATEHHEGREALREQAILNRARAAEVSGAIRSKLWDDDDGIFYSYDGLGAHLLKTPTVSGFGPLMAGIASAEQADWLTAHLQDPQEFHTSVPVPSTAASSPSFNALRYWSGPSWPVTNWLVARGLSERGSPLAEALRVSTLDMIAEGVDYGRVREAAAGVLEMNSFEEQLTTPSKKQYTHAWLWDSAIVAASWPLVAEKPRPYSPRPGDPRFWEYYHPGTGEPLGAPQMSWTASLFLELLHLGEEWEA